MLHLDLRRVSYAAFLRDFHIGRTAWQSAPCLWSAVNRLAWS